MLSPKMALMGLLRMELGADLLPRPVSHYRAKDCSTIEGDERRPPFVFPVRAWQCSDEADQIRAEHLVRNLQHLLIWPEVGLCGEHSRDQVNFPDSSRCYCRTCDGPRGPRATMHEQPAGASPPGGELDQGTDVLFARDIKALDAVGNIVESQFENGAIPERGSGKFQALGIAQDGDDELWLMKFKSRVEMVQRGHNNRGLRIGTHMSMVAGYAGNRTYFLRNNDSLLAPNLNHLNREAGYTMRLIKTDALAAPSPTG